MANLHQGKRIKIPVKFVDDTWEFFYGGRIPVSPNTIGTLIVERQNVVDRILSTNCREELSIKFCQ